MREGEKENVETSHTTLEFRFRFSVILARRLTVLK